MSPMSTPSSDARPLPEALRAQLMQQHQFNDMASNKPTMEPPLPRYEQPRGGVIVETSIGNLQFGMPPETIKVS